MASPEPVISAAQEAKASQILQAIADLGATVFFEKSLTNSDIGGTGRVVIPKAIAESHFPRLDQPSGIQVKAVDTRGHEYSFKFRFWINNQSRMYLLEGAGELHRQFSMTVGDVMVFAQKDDKSLVIAGRPATKSDVIRKAPAKRASGSGAKDGKPRSAGKGSERRKRARTGSEAAGTASCELPDEMLDLGEMGELGVDGIFRALAGKAQSSEPSRITPGDNGRWFVTLNLVGELYQAVFDSAEDASEAFNAAGAVEGTGEAGPSTLGQGQGPGLFDEWAQAK